MIHVKITTFAILLSEHHIITIYLQKTCSSMLFSYSKTILNKMHTNSLRYYMALKTMHAQKGTSSFLRTMKFCRLDI